MKYLIAIATILSLCLLFLASALPAHSDVIYASALGVFGTATIIFLLHLTLSAANKSCYYDARRPYQTEDQLPTTIVPNETTFVLKKTPAVKTAPVLTARQMEKAARRRRLKERRLRSRGYRV